MAVMQLVPRHLPASERFAVRFPGSLSVREGEVQLVNRLPGPGPGRFLSARAAPAAARAAPSCRRRRVRIRAAWPAARRRAAAAPGRSEEHTSELQSLMRISYAVFCLKKKIKKNQQKKHTYTHHKI